MPEAKIFAAPAPPPTAQVCTLDVENYADMHGTINNALVLKKESKTAPTTIINCNLVTTQIDRVVGIAAVVADDYPGFEIRLDGASMTQLNADIIDLGGGALLFTMVYYADNVPPGAHVLSLKLINGIVVGVYGAWLKGLASYCAAVPP